MRRALYAGFLVFAATSGLVAQAQQAPWRGENLQYFPEDITRPQLLQRMRELSNELARRLTEASNTAAAIAILEMNGELNPKSADIEFTLGELHRGRGETGQAIQRYRAALEKNPQHQGAKRWLSELSKP